ncbi:AIR synthase related protein [Clostridium sp.]|uniref:AIR synthase related protein n=1 Tax=Clostridium sp. TaxID=1506 RepID=UPI001A4B7B8F|nr:AIR synthase related protein [Clostridium sp.]MBK5237319.1 thiamine-monophosphate kinase [Clostridium sp.]
MSREKDLIKIIDGVMPRSKSQVNALFESDSEIIQLGDEFVNQKMLHTIDEFSSEDMLRENDPYTLGWNLAVGAISDIFATGGKPLFYSHSLTIKDDWTEEYVRLLSEGIAAVLKESGVCFLGGDFGKSKSWRYTASVIGNLKGEPLLRSKAQIGDGIYITGTVGGGNLEAFLKLYSEKKLVGRLLKTFKNRFNLRIKESELIKTFANASIDTSDGVFNSINSISEISGTGYKLGYLPYIRAGSIAATVFSIPKSLLFLGECGEYELLFTVAKLKEAEFMEEASKRGLQFYKIGSIKNSSTKVLEENNKVIDLSLLNISARDYEDIKDYIKDIISFLSNKS